MKKRILKITMIIMLTVCSLAGCGSTEAKDYYPLEELDSSGIDLETLGYFKEDLYESGLFDCYQFAFRIGFRNGFSYVTVYELDETGKELNSYQTEGDFADDVVWYTYGTSSWEAQFYQYEFSVDREERILVGERILLEKEELNQNPTVELIRRQLVEAGYPENEFEVRNDDVYYGKFKLEGPAEFTIEMVLNGVPVSYGEYTFTDSKGVITSKEVSLG